MYYNYPTAYQSAYSNAFQPTIPQPPLQQEQVTQVNGRASVRRPVCRLLLPEYNRQNT